MKYIDQANAISAWHFIREDMTTSTGNLPVVGGGTLVFEGTPELCEHGLHASRDLLDALLYARAPVICRVKIWGLVVKGEDKLVGTRRTCLWALNIERVLHEFAIACARDVLHLISVEDRPAFEATLAAKEQWLAEQLSYTALAAARKEAWSATLDAAWSAAWSAAPDATLDTAWSAARAAARGAARIEAWSAAWSAARYAAWAAALDAVWVATLDAARKETMQMQRDRLVAMVAAEYERVYGVPYTSWELIA